MLVPKSPSPSPSIRPLSQQLPLKPIAFAGTIFVVDDDYFSRSIISLMLVEEGFEVEVFDTCEAFLDADHRQRDACLVLDVHFAGMGGLELLERLRETNDPIPVVVISGSSGISEAVQSMKQGAQDFVEKPVAQGVLLATIRRALWKARGQEIRRNAHDGQVRLLASLTPRQDEIMRLVVAGQPSKNIAVDLGISMRTVDNHRAAIMHKLGVHSLAALGRLAESLSL
jgi:two-component system CheB/CheR fusion protein